MKMCTRYSGRGTAYFILIIFVRIKTTISDYNRNVPFITERCYILVWTSQHIWHIIILPTHQAIAISTFKKHKNEIILKKSSSFVSHKHAESYIL